MSRLYAQLDYDHIKRNLTGKDPDTVNSIHATITELLGCSDFLDIFGVPLGLERFLIKNDVFQLQDLLLMLRENRSRDFTVCAQILDAKLTSNVSISDMKRFAEQEATNLMAKCQNPKLMALVGNAYVENAELALGLLLPLGVGAAYRLVHASRRQWRTRQADRLLSFLMNIRTGTALLFDLDRDKQEELLYAEVKHSEKEITDFLGSVSYEVLYVYEPGDRPSWNKSKKLKILGKAYLRAANMKVKSNK